MPNCPYCHKPAKLVTGKTIYPRIPRLHKKQYWQCAPCQAYVGCHGNGRKPLGRLANAVLRRRKMEAHSAFDPIWQDGWMTRSDAYKWLADQLGISRTECHIGEFDEELCRQVVLVSDE